VRRYVQILGWSLIWSGVFVFGYLGWQLFGTDLVNAGVQTEAQSELDEAFDDVRVSPPGFEEVDSSEFLEGGAVPPAVPNTVELHTEEAPDTGAAFAFLRIPKIGVDQVLFEGTDPTTLKSGPGHMEGTPLPGQVGNAVVSGHRTTYGRPFFDFDLLEIGDTLEVESVIGTHTYVVREIQIVPPTAIWVTDPRAGGWLTLTTCNPKFSARERLVVWAQMTEGPNADFARLHEQRFGEGA
jgi:sortase A